MHSEFSIEMVKTETKLLANMIILHGFEGWGKTSWAAHSFKPIFLMIKGETGLWKLMETGQVPSGIPHFPRPAETWLEIMLAVNDLAVKDHPYKTLVIDTISGAEKVLHTHVCETLFDGEWGEKGFLGFQRGYTAALPDWRKFMTILQSLQAHGITVILLSHSTIRNFKNPTGPDYDRFEPEFHAKTWAETHKAADIVLFGTTEVTLHEKTRTQKPKAIGGVARVLKTTKTAAWDAKNRHGLQDNIECGRSSEEAWNAFVFAMRKAKKVDPVKADLNNNSLTTR